MKFLVVDDDALIRRVLTSGWPGGDELTFVQSVAQASRLIASGKLDDFDGVIVDMTLPDGSGLTIVREIRAIADLPTIVISGSGTSDTRSALIEQGADDYMLKPFTTRELHARMMRQIAIRAPQTRNPEEAARFIIGAVDCDIRMRSLALMGKSVEITAAEARLLTELHRRTNTACSKNFLYQKVFFKQHSADDKTLDVYVSRIRKKLGSLDAESAKRLQTIRGVGYCLAGEATLSPSSDAAF